MQKKKYILSGSITLFITLSSITLLQALQKRIVSVPVADIRKEPSTTNHLLTLPTSAEKNPGQITQALLNEHLIVHDIFINEEHETWLKINLLQQEFYYEPLEWHGYPGWIQENQTIVVDTFPTYNLVVKAYTTRLYDGKHTPQELISLGTRFYGEKTAPDTWQITMPNGSIRYISAQDIYEITPHVQESNEDIRSAICKTTKLFLGNPYSWGGRSALSEEFGISSVDCSALLQLCFLAHGLQIPRMSHEQFLRARPIASCKDLQPGDFIFFSSIKKGGMRMDHVMLYIDDNTLIESTIAGPQAVRIVPFEERMGQPCKELTNGDIVHDQDDSYYVYFGSFLHDKISIQALRNDAFKQEYDLSYLSKKRNLCEYYNFAQSH